MPNNIIFTGDAAPSEVDFRNGKIYYFPNNIRPAAGTWRQNNAGGMDVFTHNVTGVTFFGITRAAYDRIPDDQKGNYYSGTDPADGNLGPTSFNATRFPTRASLIALRTAAYRILGQSMAIQQMMYVQAMGEAYLTGNWMLLAILAGATPSFLYADDSPWAGLCIQLTRLIDNYPAQNELVMQGVTFRFGADRPAVEVPAEFLDDLTFNQNNFIGGMMGLKLCAGTHHIQAEDRRMENRMEYCKSRAKQILSTEDLETLKAMVEYPDAVIERAGVRNQIIPFLPVYYWLMNETSPLRMLDMVRNDSTPTSSDQLYNLYAQDTTANTINPMLNYYLTSLPKAVSNMAEALCRLLHLLTMDDLNRASAVKKLMDLLNGPLNYAVAAKAFGAKLSEFKMFGTLYKQNLEQLDSASKVIASLQAGVQKGKIVATEKTFSALFKEGDEGVIGAFDPNARVISLETAKRMIPTSFVASRKIDDGIANVKVQMNLRFDSAWIAHYEDGAEAPNDVVRNAHGDEVARRITETVCTVEIQVPKAYHRNITNDSTGHNLALFTMAKVKDFMLTCYHGRAINSFIHAEKTNLDEATKLHVKDRYVDFLESIGTISVVVITPLVYFFCRAYKTGNGLTLNQREAAEEVGIRER